MNQKTGKADIHIHIIFSDRLMSPEALVKFVLFETNLNVIAVTDRDTIASAHITQAYVDDFKSTFQPLDIIVGIKVTSADGDILALFIKDDIPSGLSATETVDLIHQQCGLAIAAHPFSPSPLLLRIDGMKGAQRLTKSVPYDGVEVRNGMPTELFSNWITTYQSQREENRTETNISDGHIYSPFLITRLICDWFSRQIPVYKLPTNIAPAPLCQNL